MAAETILQHWIFTKFAWPFLLMFFIVFAILEKTKILGDDKKQLNAMVAFVIGIIFVSAVFPKIVVGNLILFLSVGLIVMFVGLLLWGFVAGEEPKVSGTALRWVFGVVIAIGVIWALLWSFGIDGKLLDLLFKQSWSSGFWTNLLFLVVVAVALAVALKKD